MRRVRYIFVKCELLRYPKITSSRVYITYALEPKQFINLTITFNLHTHALHERMAPLLSRFVLFL